MKNTYFMSKKVMNESQFSDLIYRMVNESLDALSGYNFESNDNTNDNNAQNDDSKRRNNRRRQQVEAFFKQPGVNPAAYAYRLYRVKPVEGDDTNDMKNARSKFMKCLNHEKNEDGYEYAFDSSEVNTLFSMISGNELKENKISLSESDIMYMVNESVKRILKENTFTSLDNGAFTNSEMSSEEFWAKYENIKDECDACSEEMFEIEEKLEEMFDWDDMAAIDSIFAAVSNSGSGECDENQASIARKMLEKLYQKYGPDAFSYAYAMYDDEYSY